MRTVVKASRKVLLHAGLPPRFWQSAGRSECLHINTRIVEGYYAWQMRNEGRWTRRLRVTFSSHIVILFRGSIRGRPRIDLGASRLGGASRARSGPMRGRSGLVGRWVGERSAVQMPRNPGPIFSDWTHPLSIRAHGR